MTDTPDTKYLELFAAWLRSLGQDAAALGEIVGGDGTSANNTEDQRRCAAAGLNYLFKSLDLIPDGIDDLGFLDDAFVLRVAASLAGAKDGVLQRLGDDAKSVQEFMGADYEKLQTYVKNLHKGAARGRTVEDIITDKEARTAFTQEVAQWARDYQAPTFTRDVKTLIKLKAFLHAKL